MDAALRNAVSERADHRCEYCHLPQRVVSMARFHVEHVIPRQHGGDDRFDNLALSCPHCNRRKGPNLSGRDAVSGAIVELVDPRRDTWSDHFAWNDVELVGLTPRGRAPIAVLAINTIRRIKLRESLVSEGSLILG